MKFIADLHIHSYLSRATSRECDLEHLNLWAQIKGITVVGAGDFTHPQWFSELREKLEPAEYGLYRLKQQFADQTDPLAPPACKAPVRFMLSVEISSIYKKDGRTRKVHNVVFMPDLGQAEKFNKRLDRIGNIKSDGRPILGIDSRALLEIVLETSDDAFLIPAHIWTPWFSVLGSRSGFDSVEECFEDLTPHIFAVETGLSSDPAMNWRVKSLDRFTLVSNSDAHSPANLGREANLFDTELSYHAIKDALKTGDPKRFLGTLEYFAEEGKYHFDGHRKCGARLSPEETIRLNRLCPVCGNPVTVGVSHRVEELADRELGLRPDGAHPYSSLLPMTDILSEVLQAGPKSKKVSMAYRDLIERIGPEFEILRNSPLEQIGRHGPPLLAEGIDKMRKNMVSIAPGYDGEFGKISLFEEKERSEFLGQKSLFPADPRGNVKQQADTAALRYMQAGSSGTRSPVNGKTARIEKEAQAARPPGKIMRPDQQRLLPGRKINAGEGSPVTQASSALKNDLLDNMNEAQQQAVRYTGGPLLIVAGPGTGKTFTLTHRIAYLIKTGIARPGQILAVTFTNKAAREMSRRLEKIFGDSKSLEHLTIRTFHALCLDIVSGRATASGEKQPVVVLNESERMHLIRAASKGARIDDSSHMLDPVLISEAISRAKQRLLLPDDNLTRYYPRPFWDHMLCTYGAYQDGLDKNDLLDYDDLILKTVRLLEADQALVKEYRERFCFISVDEYQDVNYAQYRLIRLLAPSGHDLCVIGDPNQAIYGFRGADVRYFHSFCEDYLGAKTIRLDRNYRSTETILQASNQIISPRATGRDDKRIWSGIHGARTVTVTELPTERAEAEYIAKTIDQEVGGISHFSVDTGRIDSRQEKNQRGFSDFAVLCRIKEQVKALDEALSRSGIPFQVAGGQKLAERRGIAELVSYLKTAWSIASDLDLERILNFPARGIGPGAISALRQLSGLNRSSIATALLREGLIPKMRPGVRKRLMRFSEELHQIRDLINGMGVYGQICCIVDRFAVRESMSNDKAFEEDLSAFLDLARSFDGRAVDFPAYLALERAQDRYDPCAEKVSVMTIHAAKGLEFPVVFVAGCEDGLLPYKRHRSNECDIEEEGRLFYVAMTRARQKVYLTHCVKRRLFGETTNRNASPFLSFLQEQLKEYEKPFAGRPKRKRKDMQLSLFDPVLGVKPEGF